MKDGIEKRHGNIIDEPGIMAIIEVKKRNPSGISHKEIAPVKISVTQAISRGVFWQLLNAVEGGEIRRQHG